MGIKHYKFISIFIGFFTGAFVCTDIINYFSLFDKQSEYSVNLLIAQGIFALGLVCLLAFYATIMRSIKKKSIFTRSNEKAFRYFGIAILIFGIAADVLFKNVVNIEENSAPRILAFLGATLVFVSFIFKIGIKLQEEKELTI